MTSRFMRNTRAEPPPPTSATMMTITSNNSNNGNSRSNPGGRQRRRQPAWKQRKTVLQHRLQDLVVMELRKDSFQHEFKTLTLRALYNYVLSCIATRPVDLVPAVVTDTFTYRVQEEDEEEEEEGTAHADTVMNRRATVLPPDDGLLPIPSHISSTNRPSMLHKDSSSFLSMSDNEAIQEGDEEQEEDDTFQQLFGTSPAVTQLIIPDLGKDGDNQDENANITTTTYNSSNSNNNKGHTRHVSFVDSKPSRTRMFKRSVSVGDTQNNVSARVLPLRSPAPLKQVSTLTASSTTSAGDACAPTTSVVTPTKKRARLGGYLHPRDMRRLVTPFSSSNEPELIVRRHVMLLNFDPLRAIVLRDRLLVLVPDGADSILGSLAKRVRGGLAEVEDSVFGSEPSAAEPQSRTSPDKRSSPTQNSGPGSTTTPPETAGAGAPHTSSLASRTLHAASRALESLGSGDSSAGGYQRVESSADIATGTTAEPLSNENTPPKDDENDEWADLQGRGWIDMPFELQSVDAVLHQVCHMLFEESNDLEEIAAIEMDQLVHGQGSSSYSSASHNDDILRNLKNNIAQMQARVQGFVRAMNLVLNEDEDLALMNLSRLITHPERFLQPVPEDVLHQESDEPELILEAYLQQALSTVNVLDLIKDELTTVEGILNMRLDAVRNRLLYINTIVSLLSLVVAMGSFVGSIFGMNLVNHLEDDPDAFRYVVIGTCCGGLGVLFALLFIFWRAGIAPTPKAPETKYLT